MTIEIMSDWWKEKFPMAENNELPFWSGVRDNSIPSAELVKIVDLHLEFGDFSTSSVAQAAAIMLELRELKQLPEPAEVQVSG